ncbi:WD repeat containing protein [Trema orientale]|uniref:WD repeat containing protein n=1 Tax=Trema orientale TaxID=63057 RepID=A0A2P5CRM7_TREOI|nr:WD repeat containing protein [Trema orientale]
MRRTMRKVKKQPDNSSMLALKEVIGLTTANCNGLASSASSANCAYVAGCVVVVYNVDSGTQSHLMVSHRMPKPLNCVAVSKDGRFIAAGESGTQPAVLVWDGTTLALVSELKGHVYGLGCIAFSPDGKHLVSVGGYIYLWEWQSGMLLTKLKASSSCSAIASVSFSSDAKFVVTAGKKHLKFWAVGSSPKTCLNKGSVSLAVHGKAVNLGPQKESSFISITSTLRNNITMCGQAGVLCLLDSGLSVRKFVDLKVEKGFAISVSDKLVACACSNGIVQLFTIDALKYAGSLLYSKDRKGCGENVIVCHAKDKENDFQLLPTLPDAVACQFSMSEKLVVIYGDHSLYIWDIHNVNQARRCCVLLSHSACIWDIKNLCCENMHDESLACVARGCSGGVSFATCSADGTIRIWDLSLQPDPLEDLVDHHSLDMESISSTSLVRTGTFERDAMELGFSTQGFRAMAASPDGKYLAAGDCKGNLHVYDLHTFDYTYFQGAHDSEILSLSFSLSRKMCVDSKEVINGHYFLASGGRDQLIHLYDCKRNFDLIESIDDHSAAVTSVKLACNGHKILSCSADRSLVFRDVTVMDDGFQILHCLHQTASRGTVYDMAIDPEMEIVVTVGQDKKINTFDITAGKLIRSFKHDRDFGEPIKVTIDPSCSYLACSFSNKSLCIYDLVTGEMITHAMGHGEVITGVIFLPDCKHIVSVGGDGCIFVWRVPALLSSKMQQKMKKKSSPLSPKSLTQPVAFSQIIFNEEDWQCRFDSRDLLSPEMLAKTGKKVTHQGGDTQETKKFKFSVSRLPRWAQAKLTSSNVLREHCLTSSQGVEWKDVSPLVADAQEYALSSPKAQKPSNHQICSSEQSPTFSPCTNDNCSSPEPQGTFSSFAMDKRWISVYTVCLLNSPDVQDVKDTSLPVLSQSTLHHSSEITTTGQHLYGLESRIMDERNSHIPDKQASPDDSRSMYKNIDQCGPSDLSTSREAVTGNVPDVTDQLHSDRTGCEFQTNTDACHIRPEESDLFKKHFSSLSSMHKIERGKSIRRRHSARYVVHRDYLGGCKRLFDSPLKSLGGKIFNCPEETLEDPSFRVSVEKQIVDSCKQDPKNSVESLCTGNELIEAGDQEECVSGGNEAKRKIISCREALLSLDAAAENAVQLFSDLQTTDSGEEISSRPGAELYFDAARLLPSIMEKVKTVAKLAHFCYNQPCGKTETN